MKRAVILHGTSGNPDINWLPWAKKELEQRGYTVWIPLLPENNTPNRHVYDTFLRESNWDFTDNIIIGHSSGATTVLNLLSSEWFPAIDKAILVGTFLNEKKLLNDGVEWYIPGQFDNLFLSRPYDSAKLTDKANKFYFIHGENDPYCDVDDARQLCAELHGAFISVPDGLHLSSNRKDLPELTEVL